MRYSISEFSKVSGFSIDTLRYYESEHLFIVKRDKNNRRYYTEEDIDWIECIKKLKRTQMHIKTIQKYNKLRAKGNKTIPDRILILQSQLEILEKEKAKVEKSISFIDNKIEKYKAILFEEGEVND
ncbi:MerR family transcriptional regulator [Staphylococcus simulans]